MSPPTSEATSTTIFPDFDFGTSETYAAYYYDESTASWAKIGGIDDYLGLGYPVIGKRSRGFTSDGKQMYHFTFDSPQRGFTEVAADCRPGTSPICTWVCDVNYTSYYCPPRVIGSTKLNGKILSITKDFDTGNSCDAPVPFSTTIRGGCGSYDGGDGGGGGDETACEVEFYINASTVAPQNKGLEGHITKAPLSVTLKNFAPQGGCTVYFKVYAVPKSGGHEHYDSMRPTGYVTPNPLKFEPGYVFPSGGVECKYTSGEISGTEEIEVTAGGKKIKKEIQVKVDGLWGLWGYYYSLTPMPSDYGHTSTYYVQLWVKSSFDSIAELYYQRFPTDPMLVVTDASLKGGGLYDFRNTWRPPHKYHRIGTDIDVRSRSIPLGEHRREFERFVCRNTGFPFLEAKGEENEHYHLFFYEYRNYDSFCKIGD